VLTVITSNALGVLVEQTRVVVIVNDNVSAVAAAAAAEEEEGSCSFLIQVLLSNVTMATDRLNNIHEN